MVTVNYKGRLGNNMIQYVAAYILAKKHNLKLNVEPNFDTGTKEGITNREYYRNRVKGKDILPQFQVNSDWGTFFKFPQPVDGIVGRDVITINNDDQYMNLLEQSNIPKKHYKLDGFFQDKRLLYNYRDEIKKLFTLNYEKVDKDKVFVGYRIGDMEGYRQMLPKEYFIEALELLKPNGGYITSDTMEHPFVKELSDKYNLKPYSPKHPLEKIDFAKNFNNLILSEGSFNWWMGFLSKAENIIVNSRPFHWHGNSLFDFPEWNKLSWDYEDGSFESVGFHLKSYKPIKLKI